MAASAALRLAWPALSGSLEAKSLVTPPVLMRLVTVVIQLVFLRLESTPRVGTKEKEESRVTLPIARWACQLEPQVTYLLPLNKLP